MDNSPEYIAQCDCSEIQEQRPEDDECEVLGLKWINPVGEGFSYKERPPDTKWILDNVWLPRQEDLQKMVIGNYESLAYLCGAFEIWRELHGGFTSMEQLWLAFVMKEKFGKVWVNEEWIDA